MPAKFHVSLNVADLGRSVAFYRLLLESEPAKQARDYAKFELEDPPLVLSLIPGRPNPGGPLNHLGMRLRDSETLVRLQIRLETAGIKTAREDGVECCHSRQTKFWVTDPDRTVWELYVFDEADDESHQDSSSDALSGGVAANGANRVSWQHQIPDPFPDHIPHADNSVHEVTLEGSVNVRQGLAALQNIFEESFRVLRPGGEVRLHGLAGDRPLDHPLPPLPGPAAPVECVPVETAPMQAMMDAGFIEVRFERFSPKPYFTVEGVQMREILLVGRKPGHRPSAVAHQAIYLGPLAQVTDDFGNVFPRGKRVRLNIHDWQALGRDAIAAHFLLLAPDENSARAGCNAGPREKNGVQD